MQNKARRQISVQNIPLILDQTCLYSN